MIPRFLLLATLLTTLSGCIVVPRTEMTQRIDFNYVTYPQEVLTYSDVMCTV